MIAALDNYGDIYICLMQHNTNQDTFCLFISRLVEQLDLDRPSWRSDTVMQLDNAKWHKTQQVRDLLKKHRIPALLSAPYSYDCAGVEYFFSMFKRGELNIKQLGVTKSKYTFTPNLSQSILQIQ